MTDMELAEEIERRRLSKGHSMGYEWLNSDEYLGVLLKDNAGQIIAQTEIKGHMRVEDELQARIAELEKELLQLHEEWKADILAAVDLQKDALRYRWLREHFRFSHDNLHELWFDENVSPHAAVTIASREELDATIDEAALKSRA